MSVHLITGYKGQEHVTASDAGSFNAAVMGTGEFVLNVGNKLACQIISNNKVRILDGDALMQGRHIRVNTNTYEETTHENGTIGMKRIDLIVLTYEKNAMSGIEDARIEVIKGTPHATSPSVPAYTKGNIMVDDAPKNQMPLWKIPFDGIAIGTPEKMFTELKNVDGMRQDLNAKFEALKANIEKEIKAFKESIVSDVEDMSMIENYGEYVADAKTVGEEFVKVNERLDNHNAILEVGAYSSQPLETALVSAMNNEFSGVRGKYITFQLNTSSGWYSVSCQRFDSVNGIAQSYSTSNETFAFFIPHGGGNAVLKKLASGFSLSNYVFNYRVGGSGNGSSSGSQGRSGESRFVLDTKEYDTLTIGSYKIEGDGDHAAWNPNDAVALKVVINGSNKTVGSGGGSFDVSGADSVTISATFNTNSNKDYGTWATLTVSSIKLT